MCFLSVYRLKYLISIGIVISLLIGISLLYVLVYSFIISSITAQVQYGYRTLLISIFLSTALLMIFSSLSGIYGLIRRKNKFVVIYAITMVIYMISFLVLAVMTLESPQYISQQCDGVSTSQYQKTFNAASNILCKQDGCQCYFINSQRYTTQQLDTFGITFTSNSSQNLPVNAQNCPMWNNATFPLYLQLTILESFFSCAGWCQTKPNPIFLFVNVNYGIPTQTCVQALSNFLSNFGHIILISSFSVSFILFFVLVIISCLWLHPQRGLKYDSLQIFKNPLVFIDEQKNDEA